ncbi:ClC family H(+)/Cl(-) exchange transporter [Globicatella sp. HMSC072A10]|uniref:ClC family H(+)/Cl(-) exchange transporter n=1 Tax=Globicatella sp. HMSC072A10 TaxID=1739315 RepID=UPI00114C8A03|nr:ClC family H(+)/Cl(-) exchange transporter [Globicatella sp. HMSC072A10]
MLGLGIVVGAISGVIVSAFRFGIGIIYSQVGELYHQMKGNTLITVLWLMASLILGWLLSIVTKTDKDIKGSGIPQVELQMHGKLSMNWWSVLWKKFTVGTLAIGSGLMLGREGPSIQLGSVVGLGLSQTLKLDDRTKKALIACGASAGVAAAFNAPLAGLMFSIEELYKKMNHQIILMILTSSLTAHQVSAKVFGHQPTLMLLNEHAFPPNQYYWLVALGFFLAFGGYFYSKITLSLPTIFKVCFSLINKHYYGLIPLVLIIPLGIFFPFLLGGGGPLILFLLNNHFSLSMLILFLLLRFTFSMLSFGSGLPGGIFLPILSLGALHGLVFATIATQYFDFPEGFLSYLVMFSMAGYFASISKAPFTAILLVTEMVGGMTQLVPIAICVLVSYFVATLLGVQPIYEVLAERLYQDQKKIHQS